MKNKQKPQKFHQQLTYVWRATLLTTLFGISIPLNAATYNVTLSGLWDDSHVQNSLPGGAHFTTLIGATHQPGQPLWSPGTLASEGIENVAETGDISALETEIDAAIAAGTVSEKNHHKWVI